MASNDEDRWHRADRRGVLAAVGGTIAAVIVGRTPGRAEVAQAQPAARDVDLALVLAVDASGSVNRQRFELQREGYASAFANRQVLQAIRTGPRAAIAVTMFQWTGPSQQIPVAPWTRIDDEASIDHFAATVAAVPRHLFGGGTSISGAIDAGMAVLAACPFAATRRVIDISGDGANNSGRSVDQARETAVEAGIGINGLPILAVEPDLEEYYREHVIGGPGAFAVAAATFEDFGTAILRKLILEIANLDPGSAPSHATSLGTSHATSHATGRARRS